MYSFAAVVAIQPQPRTDRHRLAGTVTVDGNPAQKRVMVFNRISLELLAATYSAPATGAWELSGLPEYAKGSLLVVAFDDTGTYNAEVADYVSQVTGEGV